MAQPPYRTLEALLRAADRLPEETRAGLIRAVAGLVEQAELQSQDEKVRKLPHKATVPAGRRPRAR